MAWRSWEDKGRRAAFVAALGVALAGAAMQAHRPAAAAAARVAPVPVPGMPPVPDPGNLYSETRAGMLSLAVRDDPERVYVPNLRGGDVTVIDPSSMKVVDRFKVGRSPQHIVPAWDLRTLWVTNNAERASEGSLTPIDPRTGKPGTALQVDDRASHSRQNAKFPLTHVPNSSRPKYIDDGAFLPAALVVAVWVSVPSRYTSSEFVAVRRSAT